MKKIILFLVFALFAVVASSAQTANYQDVVYLKNGIIVRGVIVEQYPGISLKIEANDGSVYVFNMDDVEKLAKEKLAENVSPSITSQPVSQPKITYIEPQDDINYGRPLPEYKYMFGNPISHYGGRKSPALAGWMSFFVPGVGQWINGDVGGGWFFFGAHIACSVWSIATTNVYYNYNGYDIYFKLNPLPLLFDAAVTISAICDGVSRAKKVNLARGFASNINISPTIMRNDLTNFGSVNSGNYSYGLKVNVSF